MTDRRPRIHLTPRSGWMNDPNGMAYDRNGRLHVFYQAETDGPRWGHMRWGHAVSDDLLVWEPRPIALEPSDEGPDRLGCWSGSLVSDDAGVPTAFYSGITGAPPRLEPSICVATSDSELTTWKKRPEGPVIAGPPPGIGPNAFRDPFVWRDTESWAMLVGAGTVGARGTILLYRSDDLVAWRYTGPFLTTEAAVMADPALVVDDVDSPCWECPQLVRLDDVDLLIVSVVDRSPKVRPAHVMAFVGHVAGDLFLVEHAERLGMGPDFYAPSTIRTPDGRWLLFGWIPEDPPAETSSRTWAGSLTLPRVVSVDQRGLPVIALAPEVDRVGPCTELPDVIMGDGDRWVHRFDDPHLEYRVTLVPDGAASIRLDIAGPTDVVAEVRYDPPARRLTVSRMGRISVAGRDPHGTAILPETADGRRAAQAHHRRLRPRGRRGWPSDGDGPTARRRRRRVHRVDRHRRGVRAGRGRDVVVLTRPGFRRRGRRDERSR